MDVLVIGGGIGGLTTALAMQRHGHRVTVAEQAGRLSEIGAGLQLTPNAMKVIRALGLDARVMRDAFRPEAMEMRWGRSGMRIFEVPLRKEAVNRWGAEYIHVHRADLIEALQNELAIRAPDALRLGMRLERYEPKGVGVKAHFVGGATVDADVLVGADGIHSVVRSQMQGPDTPRFTQHVAWRATVPVKELGDLAPPPTACVWVGPRRHAVTYLLRRGSLANFVGVVQSQQPGEESWTATGGKEQALKDFRGWHPTIRAIVEKAAVLNRWPLYDRAPLPRWSDARVVLLGDACHPMLPFQAQGAAMAIEDAWSLAVNLAKSRNPVAGIADYENSRKPRTTRVQVSVRRNEALFHRGDPVSRFGTYVPMMLAAGLSPEFIRKQNDWIYSHDETDAGTRG